MLTELLAAYRNWCIGAAHARIKHADPEVIERAEAAETAALEAIKAYVAELSAEREAEPIALYVGDKMRFSTELLNQVAGDTGLWHTHIVIVEEIREADNFKEIVLRRDPTTLARNRGL